MKTKKSEVETEFNISTNSIRVELNNLSKAKLLSSRNSGRTIKYRANTKHLLFDEIHSLVNKYIGIDILGENQPDLQSSANALPFFDSSFDYVICDSLLEHVHDWNLSLIHI